MFHITWEHVTTSAFLSGFQVLNISFAQGRFSDRVFHPLNTRKQSHGETRTGAQDVVGAENESDFSDEENYAKTTLKLYICPNEGCCESYQHYSAMNHHVEYGKCTYQEETETV